MKGKIRVFCRIRPLLSSELERSHKAVVQKKDDFTLQLETKQGLKSYNFDNIFDEKSTQVQLNQKNK